jgi:hypothetical protein
MSRLNQRTRILVRPFHRDDICERSLKANALATQKTVQFAAIGWIVTAEVCDVSIDVLILGAEGVIIQTASVFERLGTG